MLTAPADLAESELISALHDGWGLIAATAGYRPVGWGSHHWEVVDIQGTQRFVTVDHYSAQLHASLGTAVALRDADYTFVVAPIPASNGEPLTRLRQYAITVYPFVAGQSFSWGDTYRQSHRLAVLDMIMAVHAAPPSVSQRALADDFSIPQRARLEAALGGASAGEQGPYTRLAEELAVAKADSIRRLLSVYDELVRNRGGEPVLTHGEPHPGNTMLTADGWRLIDWDTALVAPPERDLRLIDPGDGSLLDIYASVTGVKPQPSMLELYRKRWEITDIAVEVGRFLQPHLGTEEDAKSWEILRQQLP